MLSSLNPLQENGVGKPVKATWLVTFVCLNPLQENGVGKHDAAHHKISERVLIPFRKTGWENPRVEVGG